MDIDFDEFPRAECHMDEVDEAVQAFEAKYCTPVNAEDLREILMGVHADHEDCECDCCQAA